MKKLIAILVVVLIFATMLIGCKESGLFSAVKPDPETPATQETEPAETEDMMASFQEDFDKWYQKYDAFTSDLSEEYSVFKLITPKYIEQIPYRLGDLVDKYIFPEETEDVPSTSEATPEN